MNKTAVILVNLGTPDNADKRSVRRYLFEFLNDRRVINLPWLAQKILVNLIIVPFRVKNSTNLYKMMWDKKGSPLLHYLLDLTKKVAAMFGEKYDVIPAMRYGNPSLRKILQDIRYKDYKEIIIVPLFPQYASSTTGSVYQNVMETVNKWEIIPPIRFVNQFYDNESFIKTYAENIAKYDLNEYEHLIFSFHGLPMSHIEQSHPDHSYTDCSCENEMPEHGRYCYKATCYETARLLAKRLNIPYDYYTVTFQSRLSKNWLLPFTDEVIKNKANSGIKKMLIASPAFVSDCLETIVELGIEYGKLFKEYGGKELVLIPGLNDSDEWAAALKNIISDNSMNYDK